MASELTKILQFKPWAPIVHFFSRLKLFQNMDNVMLNKNHAKNCQYVENDILNNIHVSKSIKNLKIAKTSKFTKIENFSAQIGLFSRQNCNIKTYLQTIGLISDLFRWQEILVLFILFILFDVGN